MEIKSMITAIIAAVVALIIVVVVAVPIISNVTEDVNSVKYNDAPRYFAENAVDETVEYTTDSNGILYNGTLISGLEADSGGAPVVITDTFLVLGNFSNQGKLELRLPDSNVGEITNITIEPNGTFAYTKSNSETVTGTYTKIINADPNGELAAISTNAETITVHADLDNSTYIYLRGYNSTFYNVFYSGEYNTENGFSDLMVASSADSTTINAPSVTTERLHYSITFENKILADSTTINGSMVVFVPYEYHTITSSDDAIISMINVVPLLMIVGIIVSVTAIFIRTR